MTTLIDLIGVVDNLGEEQPVLNRRAAILGIVISFQILTTICVLFRLYTRFFIMRSPWWDDLFVALSLVGTIWSSRRPSRPTRPPRLYPTLLIPGP